MLKPISPVLTTLEKTIAEMQAHRTALKLLDLRLKEETAAIKTIENESDRQAVAAYAYWSLPDVHVADLAVAAFEGRGVRKKLRDLAATIGPSFPCDRCARLVAPSGRDDLQQILAILDAKPQYRQGYRLLCGECHSAVVAAQKEADEQAAREEKAELERLRGLKYSKYLLTEHWARRREKHFVERRERQRSNHDECEICRELRNLDVYHWHSNSVGAERYDDLAVLCLSCSKALAYGRRIVAD